MSLKTLKGPVSCCCEECGWEESVAAKSPASSLLGANADGEERLHSACMSGLTHGPDEKRGGKK